VQNVEVTRRFAASPQQVWDVYTDHAGWKHWAGFTRSWLAVEGKPDPNGPGAVRAFGSGPVTAFEEVLEFEAPKRMTYRVVRGGLPMKNHLGEVRFEADGYGTRVVWRCRFDSRIPGLGAPMRIFVTRFFRKALEGLARHSFPDA
jgi:uncharacterized protein YndB with AHSA1/START domain